MSNQVLKRKVQVWVVFRAPGRPVQVLILKTRKDRGAFWQPVTGGVEPGEASVDAAFREVCEETSIKRLSQPRPLKTVFRFQSRWGHPVSERGYWIEAHVEDGQAKPPQVKIDPHEHVDSEWVSIAAARRKIYFESNRKLLDLVAQKIRNRACLNSKKSSKKS
jgi:8-oxo-dGTP pyrophosphatase MutT (NUDIX family)